MIYVMVRKVWSDDRHCIYHCYGYDEVAGSSLNCIRTIGGDLSKNACYLDGAAAVAR